MLSLTVNSLSLNAGLPAVRAGRAPAPAMGVKSQALPFMDAPAPLDGSMAGDKGFDPLNLSGSFDIKWMREAELKHGRVCMLAWVRLRRWASGEGGGEGRGRAASMGKGLGRRGLHGQIPARHPLPSPLLGWVRRCRQRLLRPLCAARLVARCARRGRQGGADARPAPRRRRHRGARRPSPPRTAASTPRAAQPARLAACGGPCSPGPCICERTVRPPRARRRSRTTPSPR